MSRPNLLLYGNCQVETIGSILRDLPSVSRSFDLHVSFNFPDPFTGAVRFPPENVMESCEVFICQLMPFRPAPGFGEELLASGRGIRLPIFCCEIFWPAEVECKHDPRYPELPQGRYPQGDKILADLLRVNADDEAVVNEYLEMDFAEVFPLGNLADKWYRALQKLEPESTIKIADFVAENWRTKRLFWDSRHPANHLLGQIVRGILDRIGKTASESELESALRAHEQRSVMNPIHPSVVRALQLTWVSDDDLYDHLDDSTATRRDWYLRYVAYMRELLEIMPEPFTEETPLVRFWNKVVAAQPCPDKL